MVRRLMKAGHTCVVYDRDPKNTEKLVAEGATGAKTLEEFCAKLTPPRAAWVMVPAGGPTEETVMTLAASMQSGDIIIDGGNSFYKDDVRRAKALAPKGIHYLDAGTSGGVWGLERGYCLMVGGRRKRWSTSIRFENPRAGRGDIPRTPGREKRKARPKTATSTAGRPARGTSSR